MAPPSLPIAAEGISQNPARADATPPSHSRPASHGAQATPVETVVDGHTTHDALPGDDAYAPRAHARQPVWPAAGWYRPGAQSAHGAAVEAVLGAPADAKDPGAHVAQAEAPARGATAPGAQSAQSVCPDADWKRPTAQAKQVDAEVELDAVPTAQRAHVDAPPALKVPGPHSAASPPTQADPSAHDAHASAAGVDALAGGHARHAAAAGALTAPGEHAVQLVWPGAD